MAVEGRLSDALNKREPIAISDVRWGPVDGSAPLSDAPGLREHRPVRPDHRASPGAGSLPEMTDAEKNAHKIHKVRYDLALEAPPFRVIGTVFLYPGSEPARLLDRSSEMFLPVVDARASLGGVPIETDGVDDILINRFYLRGVEQVDRSTGRAGGADPRPDGRESRQHGLAGAGRPNPRPDGRRPRPRARASGADGFLLAGEEPQAGLRGRAGGRRDPEEGVGEGVEVRGDAFLGEHLDDRPALVGRTDEEQAAGADEREGRHADRALHVGDADAAVGAVDDHRESLA